jgi:hypothetical protein
MLQGSDSHSISRSNGEVEVRPVSIHGEAARVPVDIDGRQASRPVLQNEKSLMFGSIIVGCVSGAVP